MIAARLMGGPASGLALHVEESVNRLMVAVPGELLARDAPLAPTPIAEYERDFRFGTATRAYRFVGIRPGG